jgi:hypothetical protein
MLALAKTGMNASSANMTITAAPPWRFVESSCHLKE